MAYPNFSEERKLWKKGYKSVVGLDEAGRGPLAGPVVAAAVMLKISNFSGPIKARNSPEGRFLIFKQTPWTRSGPPEGLHSKFQIPKIKDSKKLSPKTREKLYKILIRHPAIQWGIGRVSEKVIDKINIKNAAELSMEKALRSLEKKMRKKSDFLIIDGNNLKNYKLKTINYKLIVKADEKVFSCAASSIIAKVYRDAVMKRYHKKYPRHNFAQHKGYSTKLHRKMLRKYGPCDIHRRSFKPVKEMQKSKCKM